MIRAMTLSLAVLCLAVIAGCPYSSKVPLAEPDGRALDDRLIGQWVGIDGDGDSLQIGIFPFNQREYYAEFGGNSGAPTRCRVFAFDVGGERLLHINELSATRASVEYSFARYTFSGDSELAVRFVGEKSVPKALASDALALSAFLEAHLADSALIDGGTVQALRRRQ